MYIYTIFCILLFWNECSMLVPLCLFIRHHLSKFSLWPCDDNLFPSHDHSF